MNFVDARSGTEGWRREYNEVKPRSAIGNKPPISLLNGFGGFPILSFNRPEILVLAGLKLGSASRLPFGKAIMA
jgi:hypothetical protein